MGEELLADQLVERLIEQLMQFEQVGPHRRVRRTNCAAVPSRPGRVLVGFGTPCDIPLGVLPLDQQELGDAVGAAMQERGVDARTPRAPDTSTMGCLTEEVGVTDELERQIPV